MTKHWFKIRIAFSLLMLAQLPFAAATSAADVGPYKTQPRFIIEEYHLVSEGKTEEVIEYYREKVIPVLQSFDGYVGWAVLTPNPAPGKITSKLVESFVGLPDNPILPHDAIMMDGEIRTNRQVHFQSTLKNTYNLVFHHYVKDEATLASLIDHKAVADAWRDMYGTELWDSLAREYFVNMRNHWDTVYLYETFE